MLYALATLAAIYALYALIEGRTMLQDLRYSNQKVGGIRFIRLEAFSFSFCRTSKP